MRNFMAIAALGLALVLPTVGAEAGAQRMRDQDAAFRAMRQGQILPLSAIIERVHVPGAEYIGADIDSRGTVYRLKFMREGRVIFIDVDARTGRILGRSR